MIARNPQYREWGEARSKVPPSIGLGGCYDMSEECEACECAPPRPAEDDAPLVQGGQGRDGQSVERAADIFAGVVVFLSIAVTLLGAAVGLGMVPWGVR